MNDKLTTIMRKFGEPRFSISRNKSWWRSAALGIQVGIWFAPIAFCVLVLPIIGQIIYGTVGIVINSILFVLRSILLVTLGLVGVLTLDEARK